MMAAIENEATNLLTYFKMIGYSTKTQKMEVRGGVEEKIPVY